MDETTITATSFTLFDGNVSVTPLSVSYLNQVADLTLPSNIELKPDTVYTATITTSAKDTNGVALANNYVWTFTTGSTPDTLAPTVTPSGPMNGAIDVAMGETIKATFSEAMKPASITSTTFSVKKTSDSTIVNGNISYSLVYNIASFKPTSDLTPNTNYTVLMTTKVEDLAGNTMLNDYSWTFTTKKDTLPIVPKTIAVTPTNNEVDVAINVKHIVAQFSLPMDEATITSASFTLWDGNVSVTPVLVSYSNQVVDFTLPLDVNLSPDRLYSATITTDVKSKEGVSLANNYVWSFTTGQNGDTVAPTVTPRSYEWSD